MSSADSFPVPSTSPLTAAILQNDYEQVQGLLRKQHIVLAASEKPLHLAAAAGRLLILKLLIKSFPQSDMILQQYDEQGKSPIHYAAEAGHLHIVEYLHREKKISLETKDCHGRTLLHCALLYKQVELVTYLCDQGVNLIEKDNFGQTPLSYASQSSELTHLLLSYLASTSPGMAYASTKSPAKTSPFFSDTDERAFCTLIEERMASGANSHELLMSFMGQKQNLDRFILQLNRPSETIGLSSFYVLLETLLLKHPLSCLYFLVAFHDVLRDDVQRAIAMPNHVIMAFTESLQQCIERFAVVIWRKNPNLLLLLVVWDHSCPATPMTDSPQMALIKEVSQMMNIAQQPKELPISPLVFKYIFARLTSYPDRSQAYEKSVLGILLHKDRSCDLLKMVPFQRCMDLLMYIPRKYERLVVNNQRPLLTHHAKLLRLRFYHCLLYYARGSPLVHLALDALYHIIYVVSFASDNFMFSKPSFSTELIMTIVVLGRIVHHIGMIKQQYIVFCKQQSKQPPLKLFSRIVNILIHLSNVDYILIHCHYLSTICSIGFLSVNSASSWAGLLLSLARVLSLLSLLNYLLSYHYFRTYLLACSGSISKFWVAITMLLLGLVCGSHIERLSLLHGAAILLFTVLFLGFTVHYFNEKRAAGIEKRMSMILLNSYRMWIRHYIFLNPSPPRELLPYYLKHGNLTSLLCDYPAPWNLWILLLHALLVILPTKLINKTFKHSIICFMSNAYFYFHTHLMKSWLMLQYVHYSKAPLVHFVFAWFNPDYLYHTLLLGREISIKKSFLLSWEQRTLREDVKEDKVTSPLVTSATPPFLPNLSWLYCNGRKVSVIHHESSVSRTGIIAQSNDHCLSFDILYDDNNVLERQVPLAQVGLVDVETLLFAKIVQVERQAKEEGVSNMDKSERISTRSTKRQGKNDSGEWDLGDIYANENPVSNESLYSLQDSPLFQRPNGRRFMDSRSYPFSPTCLLASKVYGNCLGLGRYYAGMITRVTTPVDYGDAQMAEDDADLARDLEGKVCVDIAYDDDDVETSVPLQRIRLAVTEYHRVLRCAALASEERSVVKCIYHGLTLNARVLAKDPLTHEYHLAKIVNIHEGKELYDVELIPDHEDDHQSSISPRSPVMRRPSSDDRLHEEPTLERKAEHSATAEMLVRLYELAPEHLGVLQYSPPVGIATPRVFPVQTRVWINCQRQGVWYLGRIDVVQEDGGYTVVYDDGDRECDVCREDIHLLLSFSVAQSYQHSSDQSSCDDDRDYAGSDSRGIDAKEGAGGDGIDLMQSGMYVMVQSLENPQQYYDAYVLDCQPDNSVELVYLHQHHRETAVSALRLRRVYDPYDAYYRFQCQHPAHYQPGQRIVVNYCGLGMFYTATILSTSRHVPHKFYTIEYDDGEVATGIPFMHVFAVMDETFAKAAGDDKEAIHVADSPRGKLSQNEEIRSTSSTISSTEFSANSGDKATNSQTPPRRRLSSPALRYAEEPWLVSVDEIRDIMLPLQQLAEQVKDLQDP